MGKSDYWKPGDWNADCDYCGQKFKSSELRLTWDGFYACKRDWQPRQPQDYVRGVVDQQSLPWSRPEPPDEFTPSAEALEPWPDN
jgi:hypothetical protein